jgi:hypothetical protein
MGGEGIFFNTSVSGSLPAPLLPNTMYYVALGTVSSTQFALTTTPGGGGTTIQTTSAAVGTITMFDCPFGFASTSTFNLPTLCGTDNRYPKGAAGTAVLASMGGGGTHVHLLSDAASVDMVWGAGGQITMRRIGATGSATWNAQSQSATAVPLIGSSGTSGGGIGLTGQTDAQSVGEPPFTCLYFIIYTGSLGTGAGTIPIFPDYATRDAAFPSPVEGYMAYISGTHELLTYGGTAWRMPWNLPWGVVAQVNASVPAASIPGGAITDIAGMSVPVTVIGSRRYNIRADCSFVTTGAGDLDFYISEATSQYADASFPSLASGKRVSLHAEAWRGGGWPPGTHTVKLQAQYTGTSVVPTASGAALMQLLVEDVGPVVPTTTLP